MSVQTNSWEILADRKEQHEIKEEPIVFGFVSGGELACLLPELCLR